LAELLTAMSDAGLDVDAALQAFGSNPPAA
jgi:hypothetical protein